MRQGRIILGFLLLWALPILASDRVGSGRVSGRVFDENGEPLAQARLTISGEGAVGRFVALTDLTGAYAITGLPLREPLRIRADHAGRVPVIYSGVMARAGFGTRRDFRLRPADVHDFLIVVSPGWAHYDEVADGILSAISGSVRILELSGDELQDTRVLRECLEALPNGVFTIGRTASHVARHEARSVPVVHAVVPDPLADDLLASNICGVGLNGGFGDMLDRILAFRPEATRIATLYDPRRLAPAVGELRAAVRARGMTLHVHSVRSGDDVDGALEDLGRTGPDAFLLLLDPGLLDARALASIRGFVTAHDLVYAVPDAAFLDAGGTFSFAPGLHEMGARAGRVMNSIIECGLEPRRLGVTFPGERHFDLPDSGGGSAGSSTPD